MEKGLVLKALYERSDIRPLYSRIIYSLTKFAGIGARELTALLGLLPWKKRPPLATPV